MENDLLKKLLCVSVSYILLIPFGNLLPEIIPGSDWLYHNFLDGGLKTVMFGILTTVITTVFLKKMEIQKELNQIKSTIFLQLLQSLQPFNLKENEETKIREEEIKIRDEVIPKLMEYFENEKEFKSLLISYVKGAQNRLNNEYFEHHFLTRTLGENINFKNRKIYVDLFSNRITTLDFNKEFFPTKFYKSALKSGLKKDLEELEKLKDDYKKYMDYNSFLKEKYKIYLEKNFYKYILEEINTLIRIEKLEKKLYIEIINGQII